MPPAARPELGKPLSLSRARARARQRGGHHNIRRDMILSGRWGTALRERTLRERHRRDNDRDFADRFEDHQAANNSPGLRGIPRGLHLAET